MKSSVALTTALSGAYLARAIVVMIIVGSVLNLINQGEALFQGAPHPGGDGSEPDVAWQCTFADVAARDADLAARAASAEFESVRVQMRKLYARFERQVFAIAAL